MKMDGVAFTVQAVCSKEYSLLPSWSLGHADVTRRKPKHSMMQKYVE